MPPPLSSYGFQKLAVEYFARAAWDQYQLPYTIVRPFNCVGIGECRALGDVEIDVGQRQARDEPRRARPGAEGAQGPGPAAHPRHRRADPALHLRRRPGPRHRHRDGAPGRAQRGLQPLHRRVHHGARARRGDLAQDQGPGRAAARRAATTPFEYDVQRRVPRRDEGQAGARLRGDHLARRRCSTRSSRGSPRRSTTARSRGLTCVVEPGQCPKAHPCVAQFRAGHSDHGTKGT